MARFLYDRFKESKKYEEKRLVIAQEVPPLKKRLVRNYIKGLAFAMPMLLQVVFTLLFGFALWSNVQMDVTDATVMALGTFLALIVSGASAQIIGRKGLYYLKMNEKILSGKVMQLLLVYSFFKIFLIALFIFVANTIFAIFSDYLLFLFLFTFVLLALLFTISSVYYVFEEYEKIFYFYLFGVAMVFCVRYLLGIGFPAAHFVALAILDAVFFYFAWKKTEKLKKSEESEGAILPRTSMLIYTLLPFYMYGLLYFIFLVTDRMVAWNANSIGHGFFVWFHVPYELGSDLALLVLVLAMGYVEIAVYEFLYKLNTEVFLHRLEQYESFNKRVKQFFSKLAKLFIFYLIGTIIIVTLFILAVKFFVQPKVFLFDEVVAGVFFISSVAFGLLSFGLLNTLILFSFSRQGVVLKAVAVAIAVDFFVGVFLANTFAVHYAVVGLLAGSFMFWWVTYRYLQNLLNKLDYYYYSAF
jgi:hypothetical protein